MRIREITDDVNYDFGIQSFYPFNNINPLHNPINFPSILQTYDAVTCSLVE